MKTFQFDFALASRVHCYSNTKKKKRRREGNDMAFEAVQHTNDWLHSQGTGCQRLKLIHDLILIVNANRCQNSEHFVLSYSQYVASSWTVKRRKPRINPRWCICDVTNSFNNISYLEYHLNLTFETMKFNTSSTRFTRTMYCS